MAGIGPIGGIPSISMMTASPLGSLGGASGIASPTANAIDGSNGAQAPGSSFLDSLGDAFNQLNGQLTAADASMADFATGGSADLHTVMLQMEDASLGLKLGVQVRDKLLEAYQEIMRTQI